MTSATPPNLRERQQLATKREISAAAMQLFEKQGYRGTTIEDIAHAVGVSARTVFRHFDTKSDLVLGWLPVVEALIQAAPLTQRSPREALAQIEGTVEDMIAQHAEVANSEAAESYVRFRRLVGTDPDLQSAICAWEARLRQVAHGRLLQLLGDTTDELGIHLIIQVVSGPIVAALEAWTHSLDGDLLTLYREAKLRRATLLSPSAD